MNRFWEGLDSFRPTYLAFQANRWVAYHAMGAAVGAAVLRALGLSGGWTFVAIMAGAVAVEVYELVTGIPDCPEPGREVEWWAWDTVGDLVVAAVCAGCVAIV